MGNARRIRLVAMTVGLLSVSAAVEEASPRLEKFVPARTDCAVSDGNVANPYSIASFFVLPGSTIDLSVLGPYAGARHDLEVDAGVLERSARAWRWKAPSVPGLYTGSLRHEHSRTPTTLNFFVMVPMERMREDAIDGYTIGGYPRPMAGRETFYRTPKGFVQVTLDNQDVRVAPHFTLKQFLCKQESGYPKYVVLREGLLVGLEAVLEGVNNEGFEASTLFVMSGYRTPLYNRLIGNVPNSRHVFGDAADIFVDQNPVDGRMDDLNGDGRSDRRDNEVLAKIVEESLELHRRSFQRGRAFTGGIGTYPSNAVHGPFVHVDLRGYQARW